MVKGITVVGAAAPASSRTPLLPSPPPLVWDGAGTTPCATAIATARGTGKEQGHPSRRTGVGAAGVMMMAVVPMMAAHLKVTVMVSGVAVMLTGG